MSKKKRIVLFSVLGLVILLAVGLLWGANYLVTFAIGRSTGLQDIAPESTLSEEATHNIVENWQQQSSQAEKWMEQAETEAVQVDSSDGLKLRGEAVISDPASQHSEGDYIGMGWPDRRDMLQWIDWIIRRDSEARIVLHGISMGGATVMMTAGEDLPGQVKAVVEDCGYTSVWDIFTDELDYLFHLPAFPLLNIASGLSSLRAGYSFSEASSLNQIAKAQVPVLFIHGSEDNFVHTDMVYRLYDACPTEKQLMVVEGAGHGNSFNHMPDKYFETVFSFLDRFQLN